MYTELALFSVFAGAMGYGSKAGDLAGPVLKMAELVFLGDTTADQTYPRRFSDPGYSHEIDAIFVIRRSKTRLGRVSAGLKELLSRSGLEYGAGAANNIGRVR